MIFYLVLILGAVDASPQRSTSSRDDRLGAIPFPGVRGSNEEHKFTYSDNSFEMKCESKRGICTGHCNDLGYAGGGCVDDVCYCHSGRQTTFECGKIIVVGEKGMSEKHRSCKTICQLLRKEFEEGECVRGKCHCKERSHIEKINKTFTAPTSYWHQTYRR